MPPQAFIYLLITFGVIFFLFHLKEWENCGKPASSILPHPVITRFKVYSIILWICSIGLAILYSDGLDGSALHLAAYLVSTLLGNVGLLLKMVTRHVHSKSI